MTSTLLRSGQFPLNPPPNEEQFVFVPGGNLGLLDASADSSSLEANSANDQMEGRFSWVQPAVQSKFSPHEASPVAPDFEGYIQPHTSRAGGQFTVPGLTKGHRKRIVRCRVRPVCPNCKKDFGRVQELKRHLKEKHMARRRCPFCNFRWTRADGIKAHVVARHAEKFATEMLEEIKALRGQRFIEFVDAYDHGLDTGPGGDIAVTSSSSPAPLPAVRAHQPRPFHHAPDTTGVF